MPPSNVTRGVLRRGSRAPPRSGAEPDTLREYARIYGAPVAAHGRDKGTPRPGALRVAFGGRKAADGTRRDVQTFYDAHRERAPAMARRYVVLLSAAYA